MLSFPPFFFLPPDLNHPPASAPQSHLQGRERGRAREQGERACALMCEGLSAYAVAGVAGERSSPINTPVQTSGWPLERRGNGGTRAEWQWGDGAPAWLPVRLPLLAVAADLVLRTLAFFLPGGDERGGEETQNGTRWRRPGGRAGGCGLRIREGGETLYKSLLIHSC